MTQVVANKPATSYRLWGDQLSQFAWDWGGHRLIDWVTGLSGLKWRQSQVNGDAWVTLAVRAVFCFSGLTPLDNVSYELPN